MLLAILFSLIFNFSAASYIDQQTHTVELYHVIVTSGKIVNKKTGTELLRGSKISSTDEIQFGSADAKAIVISTKRGRFVLAPKKTGGKSELIAFVNDVVSPLKSNSKLSTRGLEESEEISDLQNHFGDSVYVILGDSMAFKVANIYPMNANNFLVMRYVYDRNVFQKIIGHRGNVATIDKATIFVDTKSGQKTPIPTEEVEKVELYYLKNYKIDNNGKGTPELITSFQLIFLDKDAIVTELQEFATLFDEGMSYEQKLNEFYGYIVDVYGPTDKHALDDFLKANNFKG